MAKNKKPARPTVKRVTPAQLRDKERTLHMMAREIAACLHNTRSNVARYAARVDQFMRNMLPIDDPCHPDYSSGRIGLEKHWRADGLLLRVGDEYQVGSVICRVENAKIAARIVYDHNLLLNRRS